LSLQNFQALVGQTFRETPLTLLVLGILLLLLGSYFGGRMARSRRPRREGADLEADTFASDSVSAAMGLLALLLGFTFALAADRFDSRRKMVTEEANAISSTYLMAQTFGEPDRGRISGILRAYTDVRLDAARATKSAAAMDFMRQSDKLQQSFWAAALSAVQKQRDPVSSAFLQAGYHMIDVGSEREAGRRATIPVRILVALTLYMAVTAFLLGFATTGRPRIAIPLLILLTMAVLLILDLDGPTSGGIQESQVPMEKLQRQLQTSANAYPLPTAAGTIGVAAEKH
jgi:hypothetical protein